MQQPNDTNHQLGCFWHPRRPAHTWISVCARLVVKTLTTLPDAPQALPASEVLAHFGVSASKGLADEEARHRLRVFGPNTVVSTRGLIIFLHQFQSPVVYLLSAATALAFYFGELEDGAALAVVLVLNALIGFLTELKAARSIEVLRALGSRSARVRRDGHVRIIPAEQIVYQTWRLSSARAVPARRENRLGCEVLPGGQSRP
jgi:magnesium-transporting ATPase (P-type)